MRHLSLLHHPSTVAVFCLALIASQTTQGQEPSPLKLRLTATADQLTIAMPLQAPVKQSTRARIELKLLNADDAVRATAGYDVQLQPGQAELAASLQKPFEKLSAGEMNELQWMRLQYELRASDGQVLASGIEALRSRTTVPFLLTAAAPPLAPAGKLYQVRVHAKARAGRPLRHIKVQGELAWEDDRGERKLSASTLTDAAGNATLDFRLPGAVHARYGDLGISAVHGLVSRSLQQEVHFSPAGYLLLDTDKDIYQPGQILHARILRFDSNRKAAPQQNFDARITDQENTLVSRESLITDSFGVARLDWTIPANAAQGSYEITVGSPAADDDDSGSQVTKSVRIYRYDLPNFRVSAKPDRPYYLPAQNAVVTVSAEYLFGKPVIRGKVRVVEETDRTWNYREQKWEIQEQQVQIGEMDRDGHFTARFDLSKDHAGLKDTSYERFRDIDLAAYVTDLTTGRTEQRRFSLRVTKQPIHVYVTESSTAPSKLLRSYYISTFYADGRPAICKVRLSSFDNSEANPKDRPLRVIETSKYGLVKLTDLKIPDDEDQDWLLVEATDRKGLKGRDEERIYRSDYESVEVTTSHAIHKPGDPIEVRLRSAAPSLRLVVQAVRDGAVLATREATLHNGSASVVFPYDERFTDEITVVAFSLDQEFSASRYFRGVATVLYPKNRQLGVTVHLDKEEHRPGEEARLRLAVHSPDQNAVESVLGVKIVDTAVEERARTDSDFGRHNAWGWWRWSLWSSDSQIGFGGISRDDLDKIDLTQPVPADLDTVAEYILNSSSRYEVPELLAAEPDRSPEEIFRKITDHEFETVERGLKAWNEQGKQPRNQAELGALGKEYNIDVPALRDPWGTPYKYELRFEGGNHVFTATSAGPDKKFGTGDDFTAHETRRAYFLHYGKLLEQVSRNLMEKENRFIRDHNALEAELLKYGVDFQKLRDPWDAPYESRFLISGSTFITQIVSHGQESAAGKTGRGMIIWESRIDYFTKAREHIDRLLNQHLHAGGAYPEDEEQFKAILRKAGVDIDELRDPWDSPYYVVFSNVAQYGDRVTIQQTDASGKRSSEPVTLIRKQILLMSPGPDRKAGGNDDFQVASYSVLVSEQSAWNANPEPPPATLNLTANTGAITGTVVDPSGAVIAGALVQATREESGEIYSTHSDSSGRFELRDLKPGKYQVEAAAQGFQTIQVTSVPVQSMHLTEVSFKLSVGTVSETVEVQAAAPKVATSSTTVERVLPRFAAGAIAAPISGVMSTPRLRQDFPETMLWEPALVTDRRGHAKLNFKMADNITTWKLTAVASTKTGELGRAEKDLRAFQPFFLEHDPPRVLTQGDEISYPVVLRNYLERPQTLKAWIKPDSWFTLLGPAEMNVKVDAGDAASAIFRYRAIAAIEGGKQQVSAANAEISDAAVKPVDVHPDGRPESVTVASIFDQKGTLVLQVPADAIAGSLKARVKIYPNLLAHVVENLEAGLARPHGCGEQTISSTYPSLLVTEFYAKSANKPAVALTAQRYLQAGYERLLRYQDVSGGFTYWGHGDPDLALTAYALEFLHHAGHFMEVDSSVLQQAQSWVLAQQDKDGSWHLYRDKSDKSSILETAYIAETLAQIDDEKPEGTNPIRASLQKALAFLGAHHDLIDEPYVMASYALAAKAAGEEKTWATLLDQLRKSVHHEDSTVYWALERNTPFYAWGRTGRLESTALALRALAGAGASNDDDKQLVRQGLLFLMRNEERDGMWYSGQTTVHVLRALLAMVSARPSDADGTLRVRVNGQQATTLDLPGGQAVAAPLEADVTGLVKGGENLVELESSTEGMMTAQFVADAYVPWQRGNAATVQSPPNSSSVLRYSVSYSTMQARTGDKIECRVRAERVGYRGYGMMLGEIGLPPGADVDRESLERAVAGNFSLYRYDVLPDRVVVYLWPTAGGSEFTFQFRPRFAMSAETAPSLLYDYYNPESRVMLQPVKFEVEQGKTAQ